MVGRTALEESDVLVRLYKTLTIKLPKRADLPLPMAYVSILSFLPFLFQVHCLEMLFVNALTTRTGAKLEGHYTVSIPGNATFESQGTIDPTQQEML